MTRRPMFGMQGFYREGVVFAMLPDKKALRSATSFAYKLNHLAKAREGEKWNLFELTDGSLINPALARLHEAYQAASA